MTVNRSELPFVPKYESVIGKGLLDVFLWVWTWDTGCTGYMCMYGNKTGNRDGRKWWANSELAGDKLVHNLI